MKIESSIKNKTCTKCKQVFPKTKEFFYTSGMYLSPLCKSCDKKRKEEQNRIYGKNNCIKQL